VGARVIHLQRADAGELKDSPQMYSQWQKHPMTGRVENACLQK
jgi:hypothetical protein